MNIEEIFKAIQGKKEQLAHVSLKDGTTISAIIDGTYHSGYGDLYLAVKETRKPTLINFVDIKNIEFKD